MSSWARVGAKCVCVDDSWDDFALGMACPSRVPMINEILTIRRIVTPAEYLPRIVRVKGGVAMSFEELPNGWFYTVESFRPLIIITQSEDVAIFAPLLNTKARESVE